MYDVSSVEFKVVQLSERNGQPEIDLLHICCYEM